MDTAIEKYVPEMIETRRRVHRHPELGWTEFETTALVAQRLAGLGFEVRLGREVVKPEAALGRDPKLVEEGIARARRNGVPEELLARMDGFTGCVGILDTGRPGPVVGFRHDMDALPITESSDASHVPARDGFASEYPGVMHACGHDVHTAVGLALARWLADHKDSLRGKVKLIFQPSEEGTRGSYAMTQAGVVDDLDWFFGGHVGVTAKPGEIQLLPDGFLATTKFDVDYTGVPSHAGSAPEKGRSALVAAANAAVMLSAIPRTSQGDTRISVGVLHAGTARNITAVHAHLECEVRGSTHEANEYMYARAVEVVKGCAAAGGVECRITRTGAATTLATTPQALEAMRKAAEAVPGVTVSDVHNSSGSEDCTFFMRRVIEHGGHPGFFYFGCTHHGHHRPDFEVQDTQSMPPALAMFVNLAADLLAA